MTGILGIKVPIGNLSGGNGGGKSIIGRGRWHAASTGSRVNGWFGSDSDLGSANEDLIRIPIGYAATLRNFVVHVFTNSKATTTELRVRKNSADSAILISIGGSLDGEFSDLSNSETVDNDDYVSMELDGPAGTTDIRSVKLEVEAT